ncbi:MAG: hypothetical protein HYX43_04645 [Burkholderiales bacterium]|nr:hypothetical protein [Burkholderiales bacterium]
MLDAASPTAARIRESIRTLPQPVSWPEVIADLNRWGWRLQWIEDAINAPRTTVVGWIQEGSTPNFEYGRALLRQHALEAGARSASGQTNPGTQQRAPYPSAEALAR